LAEDLLAFSYFSGLGLEFADDVVVVGNLEVFGSESALQFLVEVFETVAIGVKLSSSPVRFLVFIGVVSKSDVQSFNFCPKNDKLVLIFSNLSLKGVSAMFSFSHSLQFIV